MGIFKTGTLTPKFKLPVPLGPPLEASRDLPEVSDTHIPCLSNGTQKTAVKTQPCRPVATEDTGSFLLPRQGDPVPFFLLAQFCLWLRPKKEDGAIEIFINNHITCPNKPFMFHFSKSKLQWWGWEKHMNTTCHFISSHLTAPVTRVKSSPNHARRWWCIN